MKKKRIIRISVISTVVILFVALSLVIIGPVILLFSNPGDPIAKILPYDAIYQFGLYDHIQYNGVDYYLMENSDAIPDHIIGGSPMPKGGGMIVNITSDDMFVVLVDNNGVAYDEDRKEKAWRYENDVDVEYLHFNSAYYSRHKELALPIYGFTP